VEGKTGEGALAVTVDVDTLLPILRRVVGARVENHADAEDLVQEALARVLQHRDRIEDGMLEPYAISTARNLVARMRRDDARQRSNRHRLHEPRQPGMPDERLLAGEDQEAMARALREFTEEERALLLGHEAEGRTLASLARQRGSTAAALGARIHRLRARLRAEYLLAHEPVAPTDHCRTVLVAFSVRDRRRQREADAEMHLLECDFCARVSPPLLELDEQRADEIRIAVSTDPDIVVARQAARHVAAGAGFPSTELTVVATAVSEIARNIVRFAGVGQVIVEQIEDSHRLGVRIVARDAGPGIVDLERAMQDGYSTYRGLGLGLPGARRLMDEFEVVTRPGRGTTVTMTKWHSGGRR
jgi:RNA polymerase sigma factor (sigma-70 family)